MNKQMNKAGRGIQCKPFVINILYIQNKNIGGGFLVVFAIIRVFL